MGSLFFMYTGTQRKYVSMRWRVPGARVGEKVNPILDLCILYIIAIRTLAEMTKVFLFTKNY